MGARIRGDFWADLAIFYRNPLKCLYSIIVQFVLYCTIGLLSHHMRSLESDIVIDVIEQRGVPCDVF